MSMRELFMAGISANELHGEEGMKVTCRTKSVNCHMASTDY